MTMTGENIVNTFDMVSFITGIVSIILAIVSLVVTFVFYKWNEKSTEQVRDLSNDVKCKTETLSTLFNKMFDTSFRMIESQSTAMQRKLFSQGMAETNEFLNYEFEILSLVVEEKQIPIQKVIEKFNIEENRLRSIVEKIQKRGTIKIENDKIVFCGVDRGDSQTSDSSQHRDT